MKSIMIALSFIAVFTVQLFAQVDIPVFEKLAGKWQSSYELNGERYNETVDLKWFLNHNFLGIDIRGENKENDSKSLERKALEMYTLSSEGKLAGWSIDIKGYSHMMSLTGTFDDSTVTLTGTNENAECTIIYELRDKMLSRK